MRIAIHGAAGRMGKRLVALASADEAFEVGAAIEAKGHLSLGRDAGEIAGVGAIGVAIGDRLDGSIEAVIDFSVPRAAVDIATLAAERNIPLMVATTGLDDEQEAALRRAAERVPVVWAPNTSLAVNLTMKLAQISARTLNGNPAPVDVEIVERHHRFKEDAPSGTALRFGRIIAQEMGIAQHQHGREGRPGVRPHDQIGYHAIRAGDHPGEHRILFGMPGESIELYVGATSRDSYAQGALTAARWVVDQPPGVYGMWDVLGL